MKKDIFLRCKYEKVVYVYMLIRYCMHNILANIGKNIDVIIWIETLLIFYFIYLFNVVIKKS